ncbi:MULTISPECIES: L,D-transpeptidase [Rhizobium]|uniref:L,D-transpeptidase n=1 Tax=Rhizobium TaxID=379 RepID=UPI001B31DDB9|nr:MULTISPECIES: L,D-transpeptidase [Rhizobium]MBX4908050.1 L,D-transpeptidase [Rhizobium bangladeshense]MBX5214184.1 L,D-transpeptidase [Rhizobium sp. NLR9a]MBX5222082.1 L,D-transpeptidase [Rhizobium sp. NLR8a]MBX5226475.1 L,D-transpeptidase [Rhizobium sp. NLR9b]MBX5233190.1 L,D-transpeptidase [Rhizobium sp. NLR4a]
MMKHLFLASVFCGIFSTAAIADDRYATRPPIILSPDLTAPWINQLGGKVRPVVYQRPVVQPQQRGLFQRRVTRQAQQPAPQTVSAINPGIPAIRHPIEPQYLPQMVDYDTTEKPGTIVIDTNNRFLYLVMNGGKARRYGVGVGKPGFEWAGVHKITRKTEWPDWTPPSEMISREAAKGHYLPARMDGGLENPLGARAMYLGSTLYRIHGTNAPWSIGSAVSSGCIRLRNEDVVDLYDRVNVGTRVIVM